MRTITTTIMQLKVKLLKRLVKSIYSTRRGPITVDLGDHLVNIQRVRIKDITPPREAEKHTGSEWIAKGLSLADPDEIITLHQSKRSSEPTKYYFFDAGNLAAEQAHDDDILSMRVCEMLRRGETEWEVEL